MGEDIEAPAFMALGNAIQCGDWALALVELCAATTSARLRAWEITHKSTPAAPVEHLMAELERLPNTTPEPCIRLLQALDRLAKRERLAIRQTPKPITTHAGTAYWLIASGRDTPRPCAMAKQAANLAHWLVHHTVVPERVGPIRVAVRAAQGGLGQRLSELAAEPAAQMPIWIGHFDDTAQVQWNEERRRDGHFVAEGIQPAATRDASLNATLEAAWAASAFALVLPELAITVEQRRHLLLRLALQPKGAPLLCVAGSFHEHSGQQVFNCAPLIDGTTGETLFFHRKLRPYGNSVSDDAPEASEAIHLGDTVYLLVSDAGSFTVLICKDHIDSHPDVATLMQTVAPHWLFVPSYGGSKTLDAHLDRARKLCEIEAGCHVVVANIRNLGIEDGPVLPGFGHAAGCREPMRIESTGGLVRFDLPGLPPPRPTLQRVK